VSTVVLATAAANSASDMMWYMTAKFPALRRRSQKELKQRT
jgi:hypothetical protein